jgi:hypothetical protein
MQILAVAARETVKYDVHSKKRAFEQIRYDTFGLL